MKCKHGVVNASAYSKKKKKIDCVVQEVCVLKVANLLPKAKNVGYCIHSKKNEVENETKKRKSSTEEGGEKREWRSGFLRTCSAY
jgi:hypothetical protein